MAQIPSNKPIKTCPMCSKEVRNLGFHVANYHPKALEQLENIDAINSPPSPPASPTPTPNSARALPAGDTSAMVREKLETMLNIKLIQMLERGATIEEVQRALNPPAPPQPLGIRDIIEFHNSIYGKAQPGLNLPASEDDNSGGEWITLANNALPIIAQLITARNQRGIKNDEFREYESGGSGILKPISEETTRDSTKPGDDSGKSRDIAQGDAASQGELKTIDFGAGE